MARVMMRKLDGPPPAFVHDLHREYQILQERSVCGCGSQSLPHHGTTATPCRQRTEEYVLLARFRLAHVHVSVFFESTNLLLFANGDVWIDFRERDASIICHVHHALRHYNATNPGSEFVPVKPLMAAYVGFQSHIWVHVGFVAHRKQIASSKRRRNQANDTDKTFFAELRYSHHHSGAPAVET